MPDPSLPLMLVRTTVATRDAANALAETLVQEGLAACAHVAAVQATYRWQGALLREEEFLVEARTTADREEAVRLRMAKDHPYQMPLIESMPVLANAAYARWAAGPPG